MNASQSDHECEAWNSGGVCSICRRTIDVFSPSPGAVSVKDCAVDLAGETGTEGNTRVKALSSSTSTIPPAPTEEP